MCYDELMSPPEVPSDSALSQVEVTSLYYTGDLNKRWRCYLLADEPDRLVLVRANGSPLWTSKGTFWLPPGPAIEIYPRREWFNIFYGFHSDPTLHTCYINVALPPRYAHAQAGGALTLTYVDLDLDIGVNRDFSYVTYDEDEFLSHCDLWRYPSEVCERARATFDDLLSRVHRRDPLFREWERYWPLIPEHFATGTAAALFPDIGVRGMSVSGGRSGIRTRREIPTPDP